MSRVQTGYADFGFARPPMFVVAATDMEVYRCWGARSLGIGSDLWGKGWFGKTKPRSVLDAEMQLNVVLMSPNGLHFVSTVVLLKGAAYWIGPIGHKSGDMRTPADQIYVEGAIRSKLRFVSTETLRHDAWVAPFAGRA